MNRLILRYTYCYITLVLLGSLSLLAQESTKDNALKKQASQWYATADSAYDAKDYAMAAPLYEKAASVFQSVRMVRNAYYNAACSYSLVELADKTFEVLDSCLANGYKNADWIKMDSDFNFVRQQKTAWQERLDKVDANVEAYYQTLKFPDLAKELSEMVAVDQKFRHKISEIRQKFGFESPEMQALLDTLKQIDEKNTLRMKEIVSERGWLTFSDVGEQGGSDAWLLVQHADRSPDFQKQCLPLIKTAYEAGEASGSNYAYLYDRVALKLGEKQRYGTQARSNRETGGMEFSPIEAEHLVQARRDEMGIKTPISDYAQRMGFSYQMPIEEEFVLREKLEQENYVVFKDSMKQEMKAKRYKSALKYGQKITSFNGLFTTDDLFNTAICAVKAKNDKGEFMVSGGFFFLEKALVKGFRNPKKLQKEKAFKILAKTDAERWKGLLEKAKP